MAGEGPPLNVHINAVGPWVVPEALLAMGCRETLKQDDIQEAEGFVYSKTLAPSIVFKPKIDDKERTVYKITVSPQY